MKTPSIGVAVPAKNASLTLNRALQSIRNQSEPPKQVVIVDDHSTDATREVAVAEGFRVVGAVGTGVAAARNQAVSELTTDYVAFLDADDAWPVTYCEIARAQLMRARPDVLVVPARDVDETGRVFRARPLDGADVTALRILRKNSFTTSGTIVSRSSLERAGGFEEGIRHGEDLDLWVRLVHGGAQVAISPTFVYYRVRNGRESLVRVREVEADRAFVLRRCAMVLGLSSVEHEVLRRYLLVDVARRYAKSGHRKEAFRCLWAARGLPQSWAIGGFVALPMSAQHALRRLRRAVARARATGRAWPLGGASCCAPDRGTSGECS